MARLSWFPRQDRDQSVRFRRYLIAAGTSLMMVFLLAVAVLEGSLAARPFAVASGTAVAAIAAFYALFRSGLNQKAKDPSLTVPMMVAAICVVSYSLYHLGAERGAFLLMYPVIMFFGVFRLDTRALLAVCAFVLGAYASVLALLAQRPSALDPPRIELIRAAVLAAALIWFALMGGYVHDLRNRLRQSGYDELTRAYSRRRVLDTLGHEKIRCDRGAGALSICLVDIDLFKSINDRFGHGAGDLALQSFVRIAQAELRAIDFIGRYGGDEFLMVLVETPLTGARGCAERVRRQMEVAERPEPLGQHRVTVSIGVAQYRPGELLDETLRRADEALYRAKTTGRNRVEVESARGG